MSCWKARRQASYLLQVWIPLPRLGWNPFQANLHQFESLEHCFPIQTQWSNRPFKLWPDLDGDTTEVQPDLGSWVFPDAFKRKFQFLEDTAASYHSSSEMLIESSINLPLSPGTNYPAPAQGWLPQGQDSKEEMQQKRPSEQTWLPWMLKNEWNRELLLST